MTDDRNYTVTCNIGRRYGNLTRSEAMALATKLEHDWQHTCGITAEAHVFYRDGAEVAREEPKT